MLRKLIVFAVTTGLAKKAWDMYNEKGRASGTSGVSDVTPRASRSSSPLARSTSGESSRPSSM